MQAYYLDGLQMTAKMTIQPRVPVLALAAAITLSACGDGSAPITGENSVISTTSVPVIGTGGMDLTAVNQQNFPLAGALPLQELTPEIGAATPEESDTNAVLGVEPIIEEPTPLGAPTISVAARSDFFNPPTALAIADRNGQFLLSLTLAISSPVVNEFVAVTQTDGIFSDDTLEISKRIADKSRCDDGTIESSFDMNGTQIIDGSVVFNNCISFGYTLNGEVVMASEASNGVDNLRVGLRSLSAVLNNSTTVLGGELTIAFAGEAFRMSSELIEISENGDLNSFREVDLLGLSAANGARNLTGTATFQDNDSDEAVEYTFTDVSVVNGLEVPSSGTTILAHVDGSSVEFDFETGDPQTFMYTVIQSDNFTTTFLEEWENIGFRVPLPE